MILDYGDMSEVVAAVLTMHWPAVDAQADLVWQAACLRPGRRWWRTIICIIGSSAKKGYPQCSMVVRELSNQSEEPHTRQLLAPKP